LKGEKIMQQFILVLLFGVFVECASLLAYISGGQMESAYLKAGALVFLVIGIFGLTWYASAFLTWRRIVGLSVVLSFMFVSFYTFLGFEFYHGLVKDSNLLSVSYAVSATLMFILIFLVYCAIGIALYYWRHRKLRSAKVD